MYIVECKVKYVVFFVVVFDWYKSTALVMYN